MGLKEEGRDEREVVLRKCHFTGPLRWPDSVSFSSRLEAAGRGKEAGVDDGGRRRAREEKATPKVEGACLRMNVTLSGHLGGPVKEHLRFHREGRRLA